MRLDKYLKVSRLIKRRTVANDVIEIQFGNKSVKVRVTDIRDTTKKEEAKDMFEYI